MTTMRAVSELWGVPEAELTDSERALLSGEASPRPIGWSRPLSEVGEFVAPLLTSQAALPLAAGTVAALVGSGESCKSLVAIHAGLDVAARGGSVLILDGEMSARAVRYRVRCLGATDDQLARIHYAELDGPTRGGSVLAAEIIEHCERLSVCLVIVDSVGALLTRTAKSENDNVEVTRVFDRLRHVVTDSPRAMLLVDHVARSATTSTPRGASAKFNALDLQFGMTLAPGCVPSTERDWSAVITTEKDRHGLLKSRHDRIALFRPLGNHALHVDLSDSLGETHRLTTSPVDRALAEIGDLDPPPRSANDAATRVRGTRTTVLAAYKVWAETA